MKKKSRKNRKWIASKKKKTQNNKNRKKRQEDTSKKTNARGRKTRWLRKRHTEKTQNRGRGQGLQKAMKNTNSLKKTNRKLDKGTSLLRTLNIQREQQQEQQQNNSTWRTFALRLVWWFTHSLNCLLRKEVIERSE